jgi:hypothetical protein
LQLGAGVTKRPRAGKAPREARSWRRAAADSQLRRKRLGADHARSGGVRSELLQRSGYPPARKAIARASPVPRSLPARSDRPGDEPPRDSYGHQAVAPLSGLPLIRCSALLARPRRSPALSTRAGVGSWRSRKLGAQFGAQYERNRGKPRDRETAQECGIRPQPTRLRLVVVQAVAGSSPVAHPPQSRSWSGISHARISPALRSGNRWGNPGGRSVRSRSRSGIRRSASRGGPIWGPICRRTTAALRDGFRMCAQSSPSVVDGAVIASRRVE